MKDSRFVVIDALTSALVGAFGAIAIARGGTMGIAFVIAVVANELIGCFVLSSIDDEQERLRKWVDDAPLMILSHAVIQWWPVVLWIWWRHRPVKPPT